MSSVTSDVMIETVDGCLPAARNGAAAARPRHVLLIAGFVGLIFFITDHGFKISLYEDYSGTSEYMETVTNVGNISRQIAMFALGIGGLFVLVRDRGYRLHIRSLSAVLIIAAAA